MGMSVTAQTGSSAQAEPQGRAIPRSGRGPGHEGQLNNVVPDSVEHAGARQQARLQNPFGQGKPTHTEVIGPHDFAWRGDADGSPPSRPFRSAEHVFPPRPAGPPSPGWNHNAVGSPWHSSSPHVTTAGSPPQDQPDKGQPAKQQYPTPPQQPPRPSQNPTPSPSEVSPRLDWSARSITVITADYDDDDYDDGPPVPQQRLSATRPSHASPSDPVRDFAAAPPPDLPRAASGSAADDGSQGRSRTDHRARRRRHRRRPSFGATPAAPGPSAEGGEAAAATAPAATPPRPRPPPALLPPPPPPSAALRPFAPPPPPPPPPPSMRGAARVPWHAHEHYVAFASRPEVVRSRREADARRRRVAAPVEPHVAPDDGCHYLGSRGPDALALAARVAWQRELCSGGTTTSSGRG